MKEGSFMEEVKLYIIIKQSMRVTGKMESILKVKLHIQINQNSLVSGKKMVVIMVFG